MKLQLTTDAQAKEINIFVSKTFVSINKFSSRSFAIATANEYEANRRGLTFYKVLEETK